MPKLINNEAERLDERMTFNITKRDRTEFLKIAKANHTPFGQVLRELVRVYLAGYARGKGIPARTSNGGPQ